MPEQIQSGQDYIRRLAAQADSERNAQTATVVQRPREELPLTTEVDEPVMVNSRVLRA